MIHDNIPIGKIPNAKIPISILLIFAFNNPIRNYQRLPGYFFISLPKMLMFCFSVKMHDMSDLRETEQIITVEDESATSLALSGGSVRASMAKQGGGGPTEVDKVYHVYF